jgi:hypothetical protein
MRADRGGALAQLENTLIVRAEAERWTVRALTVTALWLCSCESAAPSCDVQRATAPLTNGTARAEYLKLESAEENAVADIRVNPGSAWEERCTGVLVKDRSVLTAKHCASSSMSDELSVSFGPVQDGGSFATAAQITATHPDSDVMVLTLRETPVGVIDVVPLPLARALPEGFQQGSLVQLAGYGADAVGDVGQRTFSVEAVLEIGDSVITVSAGGLSGACFGDSGGPLLIRANDGHASMAGVLRAGAVSCFGRDSYTRIDILADWLVAEGNLALLKPSSDIVHETLGGVGRCFDNQAVWFEAGQLRASSCDGDCGWSSSAGGYRCLAAGTEPCGGVSELGSCKDGVAMRCVRGHVEHDSCTTCGFSCARSPQTGNSVCLTSPANNDSG